MKVNSKGSRRKDITMAKIVKATLNLISEKGVEGVTYRRISESSGVSLSSLTYHFKDRNDLLAYSFTSLLNTIREQADSDKEESVKDLPHMLDSLVEHFNWKMENPGMMEAEIELILFARRNQDIARILSQWLGEFEQGISQILEKLGVQNPMLSAKLLMNVYYGNQIRYLNGQLFHDNDLRILLDGVVAGFSLNRLPGS